MPCGRFGGGGGHVPLLPPLGSGTASEDKFMSKFDTIQSQSVYTFPSLKFYGCSIEQQ